MYNIEDLANEYIKCASDKSRIYMIEHYLKTYDATQQSNVAYSLFPRQKVLCKTLGNANNVVTTKPRQAGITTTCGAFISCEMVLADKESPLTILVIGNTIDLAMQMVTKIKDFLLQFPAWMWGEEYIEKCADPLKPPSIKQLFNICNTKELILKNGCRVVARSSGPDASRGVGGVSWLIFDEAAFIVNGRDVYASALPTVSTGGHIVLISTPNGKDKLYYETCRLAKQKGTHTWNNFELIEMKWYQDPRYNKHLEWTKKNEESGEVEVIKTPCIDNLGNIEYNEEEWEKMIEDGWKPRSPWYIKMCKQFNNDSQKIAQELDVSFLGSDSTVVPVEVLEMQRVENVKDPDPNYRDTMLDDVWIWKPPYEGHRYIISVDCSRGDVDDATAIEVIDMDGIDENGLPCVEQVMEYNGKLVGDDVGVIVNQYGLLYNQAFCVVESIGGYGDATLLKLMALKYPNLYYDDPNLKNYTDQTYVSSLKPTKQGLPGFHSSSLRFQMISNFVNLIKTNQFRIRSKRVISELETWIFKGGRIDHKDGCHDDTLTCLAMGLFVMEYSMKQALRNKEKDKARLNAMLNITSRIETNHKIVGNTNTQNKISHIPMIQIGGGTQNSMPSDYGEYSWLLK